MSSKRQLVKALKILSRRFSKFSKKYLTAINKSSNWLLRTLFITRRRRESANAGFVLPTVAMVALVVVLLTTAILFRSFDRSKNASNVRVNEVALQAVTPALDRAKAKMTELFADRTLPRSLPSDATLYKTLIDKLTTYYTLGDETPVIVGYNLDKDSDIEAPTSGSVESKEVLETAWKFPVDTDNNGRFDSFTIYGIYFRNPPYNGSEPERKRSVLESRTAPLAGKVCDSTGDTSASLIGGSSWYKVPTGEYKKSFFIYAVTVPINDQDKIDSTIRNKYENYKGNKGFSAIELQQDREQLSLTNNAVVYEDDLDITPGPALRLNGRIFTNSNFFTRKSGDKDAGDIRFFQVSSVNSCYYDRENGKITIGGNVATNSATTESSQGGSLVDLFKENGVTEKEPLDSANKSATDKPNEVAYNAQAYAERIDLLVKAQSARDKGNDPQAVEDNIARRIKSDPGLDPVKVRKEELEIYFRQRTRRVPFKEVELGSSGTTGYTESDVLEGKDNGKSNNELRPPDAWIYPTDTNTKLTLTKSKLPAIDPDKVDQSPVTEEKLGDRILVGNNLPELRWDSTNKKFVGEEVPEKISGQNWEQSSDPKKKVTTPRTRTTRVKQLADLGVTGRDGFWETSAASTRADILDVLGGLRVITSAGVYSSADSNLIAPPAVVDNPKTSEKEDKAPVVWSDAMPMVVPDSTAPLDTSKQTRGHLVMRATAVYHYNIDPYKPDPDPLKSDNYQKPIACVSSYYNPTNSTTATTDGYNPNDKTKADKSNNGFSYKASTTTSDNITRGLTPNTDGQFSTTATAADVAKTTASLQQRLQYQANLVFPNGQFVNPLLRQALKKATDKPLSLSEQAAIDSTICALEIADGTLTRDNSVIPDQAIRETAFLDARQIKAVDKGAPSGKYDLEIEQRQPLEIRTTIIDLDALRKKSITGTWASEYLLPNSGIIYASRDDARPDTSDPDSVNVSATDYKLDPNRRPNSIMLINGGNLSRQNDYRPEEKGLIFATDLPVYVKGDNTGKFNTHSKYEFTDYTLTSGTDWDTNFYKRAADNRDPNFACRPKDPRLPKCTTGETWRPAAVIADAVTLLSDNFIEGYRSDGDFDLRNNRTDISNPGTVRGARLKNGFWDNNFVTSKNFTDSDYSGINTPDKTKNSSYFNNFVTPIQRRVNFPEYVMEMCFKLNVAECGATDWYVGLDSDTTKKSSDVVGADVSKLIAGTTATSPKPGYEKFPRRVAFKRNTDGKLLDKDGGEINPAPVILKPPVALGIKSEKVDASGDLPNEKDNALWFTTVVSPDALNPPKLKYYNKTTRLFYSFPLGADATFQPLLEPILQINVPKRSPSNESTYSNITKLNSNSDDDRVKNTRWLPKATETTFNLVIAAGDTPVRVGNTTKPEYEINGGLHNFPRFLENWDAISANITGSFIQFKRSAYATAPFQVFVRPSANGNPNVNSLFSERNGSHYHTDSVGQGVAPFYMAPVRNWGFDVALLSQNPDLFAQRFVTPTTDPPDEYYREVSRDDRWVQALLCATQDTTAKDGFDPGFNIKIKIDDDTTKTNNTKYALPASERPSSCPVNPD
ncbi:MAG: hormogonium polysaccharide biosynthesis protein HpsA [Spirirestis rafaelensis WJT71-NPBG6]|jgi:hypothetical protein|nr:hormogonium polysaccharide biosynthesis protein HpsA [Spirirestis rafaelensis WJT71-NPBG6]